MGKVLVLCTEDQERWKYHTPKQVIPVFGEPLLQRTVRQVRSRMNNYPHIVSHQKCLRKYTTNFVVPTNHRWDAETLLTVLPIWGSDWTMVLLGDVLYTDELMDTIYKQREKFHYHFYGTNSEIFAISFTDKDAIKNALYDVIFDAVVLRGKGRLWELYHRLSNKPIPEAGFGYTGSDDELHYTYIVDDSVCFDSVGKYKDWVKRTT